MVTREKDKLNKVLGGISELTRLPAAVFVVDVKKEHIAVKEAQKLNIPIFAMVDTNSNPTVADFPIPANDDAYKSIDIIVKYLTKAVEEGLLERKKDKDDLRLQQEENEKRQMDEASQPEAVVGEKRAPRERISSAAKAEKKAEPKAEPKAETKTEAKKDPVKSPKKSEEKTEAKVEEKPAAATEEKTAEKVEETVEATGDAEKK